MLQRRPTRSNSRKRNDFVATRSLLLRIVLLIVLTDRITKTDGLTSLICSLQRPMLTLMEQLHGRPLAKCNFSEQQQQQKLTRRCAQLRRARCAMQPSGSRKHSRSLKHSSSISSSSSSSSRRIRFPHPPKGVAFRAARATETSSRRFGRQFSLHFLTTRRPTPDFTSAATSPLATQLHTSSPHLASPPCLHPTAIHPAPGHYHTPRAAIPTTIIPTCPYALAVTLASA